VMASLQKDPQVLITHPGRVSSFEEMTADIPQVACQVMSRSPDFAN